ncbi:MAG: UDP-N-acetylmuramate--L-alanine ligase, partial [Verrucomicrobiota bacterium]
SSAIREDNVVRRQAGERGISCIRRAECLAVLSEQKQPLVVAGMHGKTTTASMLAYVLRSAGWRCAHYIGAEIPILGESASIDEGEHFVIEADESDGTITLFNPRHSLLLNIEEEHLDHYGNLESILKTFREFISNTTGKVVYCADDKNALLLCSHHATAVSYGFGGQSDYRAIEVRSQNFSSQFQIQCRGKILGTVLLQIPGMQNVSNALGVVALATELGVPFDAITQALNQFRGASRRFEVKFRSNEFMVVDDYAHHPTEIKATLAAAKAGGWSRVIALFQPHRYTRTQLLFNEFVGAFSDADLVFLTDIYAASEMPIENVSGKSLADAVKKSGGVSKVEYEASLQTLRKRVSREMQPGDLLLTLGAGNIHQVALSLAQELTWFCEMKKLVGSETKLLRQEPMSKHTSMRIGGPAQFWCEPASEIDLVAIVRYAHQHAIPITLIGRGSNLLVRDGGISGICIHLGHSCFSSIEVEGETLKVGAGARLKSVTTEARRAKIGGLEFMEGIPGNLGGALRMNAGAMQGWTMANVQDVKMLDLQGNWHVKTREEIEVSYRSVPLFKTHIAVSATLVGKRATQTEIDERLKQYSGKRWDSQPAAPSAGCIFKNPGESPAGKLVDDLGLKNLHVGKARVSEVHGNFIVNDGGATAQDVLQLISQIQTTVKERRNIALETEVMVIGEDL